MQLRMGEFWMDEATKQKLIDRVFAISWGVYADSERPAPLFISKGDVADIIEEVYQESQMEVKQLKKELSEYAKAAEQCYVPDYRWGYSDAVEDFEGLIDKLEKGANKCVS